MAFSHVIKGLLLSVVLMVIVSETAAFRHPGFRPGRFRPKAQRPDTPGCLGVQGKTRKRFENVTECGAFKDLEAKVDSLIDTVDDVNDTLSEAVDDLEGDVTALHEKIDVLNGRGKTLYRITVGFFTPLCSVNSFVEVETFCRFFFGNDRITDPSFVHVDCNSKIGRENNVQCLRPGSYVSLTPGCIGPNKPVSFRCFRREFSKPCNQRFYFSCSGFTEGKFAKDDNGKIEDLNMKGSENEDDGEK